MSIFVIWIDREHAKLFQLSNEKMERRTLQAKHSEHHTHDLDALDGAHFERALFSEVVSQIPDAEKLLILGPGVAKHHFRNYLGEHFPRLAKKVVGCETADHPTDPQIAAYARRFLSGQSA